ncbi:adaptor protein MecA [Enterococcus dongliensis]|uniref:Adapter protein MecA n=1 Tax=Enterococcus dongliensis TaxID=2559925 RepID=A0AAP5KPN4_9ENTE|nr:adaptor protein MecA [Enterococcus dongliensis]MDT2596260.1 adaptor protein MecA [Enterococcus dongliensis]MDT2604610.1 adaptor protein MecA [Enterococcus dongliensis]MDT2634821.1 adaptor protein MecA [Enterococcus dongliensis]MDT2637882.1 adaptor protein MecA [Enterococcus dongliensis]MDT2639258.1 adaptor protein MecA [Enterococcus dongliensis]
MEMEHINENTIRVIIENEDLAERGITFLDLLGNHREIESFFYSILEEVDIEDEFKSSEAVTFQVLPKNDGLELFISKNLTPEDLNKMNDSTEFESSDFDQLIRQQILANSESLEEDGKNNRLRVFQLGSFEDMIELASYHFLDEAWCDLYLLNETYYLQVYFDPETFGDHALSDVTAEILEYAQDSTVSTEMLEEYGKLLMKQDAIETTRSYFN